jgi:hypothetical protein
MAASLEVYNRGEAMVPEACLWTIRRNRWRWSIQLHMEDEVEEDLYTVVSHEIVWFSEIEEFRIGLSTMNTSRKKCSAKRFSNTGTG